MADKIEASGYDENGNYQWHPEDVRLRQDGMAADGSRLNVGDILEDGTEWSMDWPDTPVDPRLEAEIPNDTNSKAGTAT